MLAYKRLRPRKGKVALTPGGLPGRDNCRPKKEEVTPMEPVSESEGGRGLVEKAKRGLPGGTFGNFPSEVVIRDGRGGRVWDESGEGYVDFLLGSGAMLVGHAHREVTAAAHAR